MANVALIIPAYDEAERIRATLDAARKCRLADEIIVVFRDTHQDEGSGSCARWRCLGLSNGIGGVHS